MEHIIEQINDMDAPDTLNVDGYEIEIYYDQDAQDPYEWCDQYTTMITMHRRYNIGQKHSYRGQDYTGWDDLLKQLHKDYNIVVVEPLYMYEHGGVAVSTTPFSCPWDSGQFGWVFITREAVKNLQGWKRITQERRYLLHSYLTSEVKEYNCYLRGEVYGWSVSKDDEHIDGCNGYIGYEYIDDMKKEIIATIKHSK